MLNIFLLFLWFSVALVIGVENGVDTYYVKTWKKILFHILVLPHTVANFVYAKVKQYLRPALTRFLFWLHN